MESIVGSKFVDFSINDRCVETVRMYLKSVLLISLDIWELNESTQLELSLFLRLWIIHLWIESLNSFVVAKTVRSISKESFKIYNLSDSVIIMIRKIM